MKSLVCFNLLFLVFLATFGDGNGSPIAVEQATGLLDGNTTAGIDMAPEIQPNMPESERSTRVKRCTCLSFYMF